MLGAVKITDKRQITIPAKIFDYLGLQEGDRLIVKAKSNKLILQRSQDLIDDLAGSVKLPKKYKGKPLNWVINEAKTEYFTDKK